MPKSTITFTSLKLPFADTKMVGSADKAKSHTATVASFGEAVLDGTINDIDDDGDWEDSSTSSVSSFTGKRRMIPPPNMKSELTICCSNVVLVLGQSQADKATLEQSSRSLPLLQTSKISAPNRPVLNKSEEDGFPREMRERNMIRPENAPCKLSNTPRRVLSPGTIRRDMVAQELSPSLRKGLEWERREKRSTAHAVRKRRHALREKDRSMFKTCSFDDLDHHSKGC